MKRQHRLPGRSKRLAILPAILLFQTATAQIPRERAEPGGPVEELFFSPGLVVQSSVAQVPKGNLNVTIMHVFGFLRSGVNDLYGLDESANIRIGLDYGISDAISVGVARSRFDKLYDARIKVTLLEQSRDGRIPATLAMNGDIGITTLKNGAPFSDRLNFYTSLIAARRLSRTLSLQVAPGLSHFNAATGFKTVEDLSSSERRTHIALGFGGRILMGDRYEFIVEYLSVVGKRTPGTRNAFAVALNVETGGHIFQIFLKTSQWLTAQHVVSRSGERFLNGDIRFGFNINRVFGPSSE